MVVSPPDDDAPSGETPALASSDIDVDLLRWLAAMEARLDTLEAFVSSQALLWRRHMLSLVANIERHTDLKTD